jgi:hypothetical protein
MLRGNRIYVYYFHVMRVCHFCGARLDEKMEVHRSSTCASCGKDLKICCNCRFYSKGVHNDCLETSAEPVKDKDRSNFCDYFQFKDSAPADGSAPSRKDHAREDFLKLFGNGE